MQNLDDASWVKFIIISCFLIISVIIQTILFAHIYRKFYDDDCQFLSLCSKTFHKFSTTEQKNGIDITKDTLDCIVEEVNDIDSIIKLKEQRKSRPDIDIKRRNSKTFDNMSISSFSRSVSFSSDKTSTQTVKSGSTSSVQSNRSDGAHINPLIKRYTMLYFILAIIYGICEALLRGLEFGNVDVPCSFNDAIILPYNWSRMSLQIMYYHRLTFAFKKLGSLRHNPTCIKQLFRIHPILWAIASIMYYGYLLIRHDFNVITTNCKNDALARIIAMIPTVVLLIVVDAIITGLFVYKLVKFVNKLRQTSKNPVK